MVVTMGAELTRLLVSTGDAAAGRRADVDNIVATTSAVVVIRVGQRSG